MKELPVSRVTEAVRALCSEANRLLPPDVEACIRRRSEQESWPAARDTLENILRNIQLSRESGLPLCQDTGMACVFLEVGQEVHFTGGGLYEAIHEGVRQGYREGLLRASVVRDPLRRENTRDNTPAVIDCRIVPGDRVKITLAPKGFGSENMSRLQMLKPSDGLEGVKRFVLETVRLAGPNPCPPVVVGVGLGGTFDRVALLAKKALLRPLDSPNPDPFYGALEEELCALINETGIGPQGFGGRTTALGVRIEAFPTHIAGLPAAVNINCHVTRHACTEL
ncbi:MAG: fumarate hydratase [Provencibacterium sp.]|jgi:fumarate hydratase subunit alpha|nr:fumarate hydratase [Provencibacterium sp.]